MSFCPSDYFEPPFSFGESEAYNRCAQAKCEAWVQAEWGIVYSIRKVGDLVTIIFPEILLKSFNEGKKDMITFSLELKDDDIEKFLGKNPKSMRFINVGIDGARNQPDFVACEVDIDFEGNVYISPVGEEGFTPISDGDSVGMLAFSISFLPNDEEDKMEDEEEQEGEIEGEEEEENNDDDEETINNDGVATQSILSEPQYKIIKLN